MVRNRFHVNDSGPQHPSLSKPTFGNPKADPIDPRASSSMRNWHVKPEPGFRFTRLEVGRVDTVAGRPRAGDVGGLTLSRHTSCTKPGRRSLMTQAVCSKWYVAAQTQSSDATMIAVLTRIIGASQARHPIENM